MTTTESAVRKIDDQVMSALAVAYPEIDWPELLARPGRANPQECVDALVALGYDADVVRRTLLDEPG